MTDSADPLDLDFTNFNPLPPVTATQTKRLTAAVEVGSSELKATGFFVVIPRRIVNTPDATRKPLILIIDDEAAVCEVLSIYLEVDGYQTRSAKNRDEIMRELQRQPLPDLILCDVEMPDVNGFDLLNKFRQSNALKQIPVVMLTGRSEKKDITLGLSLGAVGYITKPAKLGVVENAVRKLLRPDGAA
jgi:CheY-like chemotaxis protein